MKTTQTKENWPWPAELDALSADPGHHKLLLENDKVRVLDTCVKPGEMTEFHTHELPATLYIISWSDFIRYDKDGNIVVDSRTQNMKPEPSTAIWIPPLPLHRLKNVGQTNLHAIAVEIK